MPLIKRNNSFVANRNQEVTAVQLNELREIVSAQNSLIKELIKKDGYDLKEFAATESGSIMYEFADSDVNTPIFGDYINPIEIPSEGITVEKGKWYYVDDKDLPHEAKEDAFVTPEDFNDRIWFDFV